MRRRFAAFGGALLGCFVLATVAFAQPVREVIVDEYAHVDPEDILQVVKKQEGMTFGDRALQREIRSAIRELMATGKFIDVVVDTQDILENGQVAGVRLVYIVREKPVVVQVVFNGNEVYRDGRLRKELGLADLDKTLVFYDENKERELIETLKAFYRTRSYPGTQVTVTTEEAGIADELILRFTLEEGERMPVHRVYFEGNSVFSARQLRGMMKTKRSWWFIIKNEYEDEVFQEDLRKITYEYRNKGYLDATIEAGELVETEDGLDVNVKITEGEPYTVDSVAVAGNTIFNDNELLESMASKAEQTYSEGTLIQDRQKILNLYRNQGYYFTRIAQQLEPDSSTHRVQIALNITETSRLRFGKLDIKGVITTEAGETFDTKEDEFSTDEKVIRRELKLDSGEVLDWSKVLEADRKLTNLGYFRSRPYPLPNEINLMPGFSEPIVRRDDPTVADILLQLEEVETGFITFGGGFSTTFGPSVLISLEKRNLLGKGWNTDVTLELGTKRSRVMVGFTEPYLLDSEWSFNTRAFWIDREGIGGRTFDEERVGMSLTFGHDFFDEYTKGYITPKVEQTDISEFSGSRLEVADIPKEFQEGKNSTASLAFTAVRDTRDFVANPTKGTLTRASVEFAALADNEFMKFELSSRAFKRVFGKAVFEYGGELQLSEPFGDSDFLPLQERFFVGGQNSVRGFEYGGIGRGDTLTRRVFLGERGLYENVDDFTVGGQAALLGTAELRYPFWEFLYGAVFVDSGASYPEIGDLDPSDLRFSAGVGLRINLPIGGIARIDYGVPIVKESEDEVEQFQFTFSQSLGGR